MTPFAMIPYELLDILSGNEIKLLMTVMRNMNREANRLKMTLGELAAAAGLSERTITTLVKKLEGKELLHVRRSREPGQRRNRVNIYSLLGVIAEVGLRGARNAKIAVQDTGARDAKIAAQRINNKKKKKKPIEIYQEQEQKTAGEGRDATGEFDAPTFSTPAPAQPARRDPPAPVWWQTAYNQLELQFDRGTFDAWLRGMVFLRMDDEGRAVIRVRNGHVREMLQNRLYRNVAAIVRSARREETGLVFLARDDVMEGVA